MVFGEGPEGARLLILGEAPGAAEDAAGRPFVGPAGRKLERLLAEIGLRRDEVYIANVVMCRPPSNRAPASDEVAACGPYLGLRLAAIAPHVVIALGVTAARALLGGRAQLSDVRGRVHLASGVRVVPTFHPSALNRRRDRSLLASADFRLARELLDPD